MSEKKSIRQLVDNGNWLKLGRVEQARRAIEEIDRDMPGAVDPLVKGLPAPPRSWEDQRLCENFRRCRDWIFERAPDQLAIQDQESIADYVLLVEKSEAPAPEIFFQYIFNRPRILRTRAPELPDGLMESESVLEFFWRVLRWKPE
jgi:hypothetical protein